jgi:hypothetical protein
VASAALGHVLFGEFHAGLTASILLGSVPGVYLAARLSARAPDHVIRPALIVVLSASALKLLGASNLVFAAALTASSALAILQAVKGARRRARKAAPIVEASGELLPPEAIEPVAPAVGFPTASP